ncbi:MAG: hypothetical protein J6W75_07165 [Bacteroidaceae bacterium]|nr:hypothetical protein [Bacteroidaceae bacterium]
MKKVLVLLISVLLANGAAAQITLQSITKDCFSSFHPNDKEFWFSNIDGQFIKCTTEEMSALLHKDVIAYYGLGEKYNTALKISVFKKSAEYSTYVERLNKERDNFVQNKSYMLYSLASNSPYDINRHCFNFKIEFDNLAKCNAPNYYSLGGGLALTFKSSYITYKKVLTNENIYGCKHYNVLRTPTISEETALRIEENQSNVSLLFVFIPTKSISENKPVIGMSGYVMTMPYVLGKVIGVYIVNEQTGEVYADISNILNQTPPKRTNTQRKR